MAADQIHDQNWPGPPAATPLGEFLSYPVVKCLAWTRSVDSRTPSNARLGRFNLARWCRTARSRARRVPATGSHGVGNVLSNYGGDDLPWWRVVRADGRLVAPEPSRQQRLLEAEGVDLENGRVAGGVP